MRRKTAPESFELVPKDEFKGILRTLKLPASIRAEVSLDGKAVLIKIRLPRARSCFPFNASCVGGLFFRKITKR